MVLLRRLILVLPAAIALPAAEVAAEGEAVPAQGAWSLAFSPQPAGQPLLGVHADHADAVAWTVTDVFTSADGGTTWRDRRDDLPPAMRLESRPIAACVLVKGLPVVRIAGGPVWTLAGERLDRLAGDAAVERMGVDQQGVLYLQCGSRRTVAVAAGAIVNEAPGRLAAVLAASAIVQDGTAVWKLSPQEVRLMAEHSGPEPGGWPVQTGPGGWVWRDQVGAGWRVSGNLECSGQMRNAPATPDIVILSHGSWAWDNRVVALAATSGRQELLSTRRGAGLHADAVWSARLPAALTAVAGALVDGRPRLLATSVEGLWVWRTP